MTKAALVLELARNSLERVWASLLFDKKAQYLLLGSAYLCIFVYHTQRSLRVYRARFCKQTSLLLVLHVLSGSLELVRYYTRAVEGDVLPDAFDVTACFIQAFTSMGLSKTLLRGDKTTRPSYQAPALMRPFVGLAAFVYKSAFIHRASVKLLHAFLYARLIIFLAKRVKMSKIHSNATIYGHGVFLGAIIAIYDSGLPAGVPVYIGMVGAVMALNRYVADSLARSSRPTASTSLCKRTLLHIFLWLGLADLEAIKKLDRSFENSLSANDEYVEGWERRKAA